MPSLDETNNDAFMQDFGFSTIDSESTTQLVKPPEPLLARNINKYVMFPPTYEDVWKMHKKHLDLFWKVEEIELSKDEKDWKSLSSDEQHFIKMVLAFFSSSDGIVAENLSTRFSNEIEFPEIRAFYSTQNLIETIHSEMYSLLIDTYVKDKFEKQKLFEAIHHYPCIKKKADWGIKWIQDKETNFATRLVAFCIIEGLFFSGSFCAIFWLKKRGLMHGLTLSNEFISRDESLHTQFACLLYKKIVNRLNVREFQTLMSEAVNIEKEFIIEALPCRLLGMNSTAMSTYIEFVADRLCVQLGYSKIFNAINPFVWMENISLLGLSKQNFFEGHNSSYSLANKTENNVDFSQITTDF